jgi:hypothetical protein
MTSQDPCGIQINRVHSGAICMEIGERLRLTLTGNPTRVPPHLLSLTELLDDVEYGAVTFRSSAVTSRDSIESDVR